MCDAEVNVEFWHHKIGVIVLEFGARLNFMQSTAHNGGRAICKALNRVLDVEAMRVRGGVIHRPCARIQVRPLAVERPNKVLDYLEHLRPPVAALCAIEIDVTLEALSRLEDDGAVSREVPQAVKSRHTHRRLDADARPGAHELECKAAVSRTRDRGGLDRRRYVPPLARLSVQCVFRR